MKISQKQVEEILEMPTEMLLAIAEAFENVSGNLFVECVRYELENRSRSHRVESVEYHVN